jgi:hypothetical protein
VERWAFHVSAEKEGKQSSSRPCQTSSAIDTRRKRLGGACLMDELFGENDLSSQT